jgi:hypothetical protein
MLPLGDRMRRLGLMACVTRFATRTLCHVVIQRRSGETRAAPVGWSGRTSVVWVGLCDTAACRLITQRLLVPVDASGDQHHKNPADVPRSCAQYVPELDARVLRLPLFAGQTEWPTQEARPLRRAVTLSVRLPPGSRLVGGQIARATGRHRAQPPSDSLARSSSANRQRKRRGQSARTNPHRHVAAVQRQPKTLAGKRTHS